MVNHRAAAHLDPVDVGAVSGVTPAAVTAANEKNGRYAQYMGD